MESVWLAEEGGHVAWIAWAIHRQAQRASASIQLHPVGRGPLGLYQRCRPGHVAPAMHSGRRLGRRPSGTRLYSE